MPRPRNTIRSVDVHLMLPETLMSRIYAVLVSEVESRIPQGAQQRFFTLAAENLLKRNGAKQMTLELGLAAQLAEWRRKALSGELSDDEMRAWITQVREGRVAASQTSAKSRARKAPIDTAALMDELDNL